MNVKYRLKYLSYDNTEWTSDILFPDYYGDIINILGVQDSALTFTFEGGVDDVFDSPIIATKATLNVYVQSDNIDVAELQSIQDREVKLKVYRNGVFKWEGYVIPDGITKPMISSYNYQINIAATDGILMMDKVNYVNSNLIPPSGADARCPLNFLRNALCGANNLNILLPIRWCIDLECESFLGEDVIAGSVQWSPRGEGFIDSNRSVLYIIESIVKSFGCRIFQWDGAWNIMRMSDIISGEFTYNEIEATLLEPTITTHEVNVNKNIGSEYPFIMEDALTTVRPPLKSVSVKYEHYQKENVLPNGNMDIWSLGSLLNWGLSTNPDDEATLSEYVSLNERPGSSVILTFPETTGGREAEFTLMAESSESKLPIESHILFKRMTLGFTVLPIYGFPYGESSGIINWSNNPLQIKVGYTINVGGLSLEYYLNNQGFWIYKPPSIDLITVSYTVDILSGDRSRHTYVFQGTPASSISFTFKMDKLGPDPSFLVATLGFLEGETLFQFYNRFSLFLLEPQFYGVEFSNFVITDLGWGQVEFKFDTEELWIREDEIFTIEDSGFVDGNRISCIIDELQIFGKGVFDFNNRTDIIMPDPRLLDGNEPNGVGELSITFFVKEGQQYILDDVWLRVDNTNDVYRATFPTVKNSLTQDISLNISSSFSGFMLSNYMTSFDKSNDEFIYKDSHNYNGSLTELYARSVMNWRYLSSIIFNSTFNTRNKDWSFLEVYTIDTLGEKKFLPIRCDYNTERCEVNMMAMEGRNDDLSTLQIEHLSSNDMPLSNFGG